MKYCHLLCQRYLLCQLLIIFLTLGTTSNLLAQVAVLAAPPVVRSIDATKPSVGCEGSTSAELTSQAWDALRSKDTGKALSCTTKTIMKWYAQADEQQSSAVMAGCKTPKPEDVKTYFQSNWALSDIAASLFIQGEALHRMGKQTEAREAYRSVVERYSCAFTWDPRGWFWKTADGAKEKLDEIKHK